MVRAAPHGANPADVSGRRSPWALVISLGIGVFIGGFDQTFVIPVLSQILRDFKIPIDEFGKSAWIINGYLLGYAVAMPLMGRVADVYGHRRTFVGAMCIFMGGSILVAIAPTLPAMAAARAITAIGGGALVPIALAMTANALPDQQRPLGLSSISVMDDASSLAGPLWGTLIGVWLGWRGLFWLNVALGLPVLILVFLLANGGRPRQQQRVDWVGGALLTAGLTALAFGLADTGAEPRPLWETLLLLALAAAGLGLFVFCESRVRDPLIDLKMFRRGRLALAFVIFFLQGGALITALVNVPLAANVLWGEQGAGPGLVLMRMVLFMMAGGLTGGVLVRKIGVRVTASLGLALAAAGLIAMRAWPEAPSTIEVWIALAVAGFGFTLADAPLYLVVVDGISHARRASAVALLQVFQTTGMLVGMALLASQGLGRFDARAADLFAKNPNVGDSAAYRIIIHETFSETFGAAAIAMLAATVLAAFLVRTRASADESSP